MLQCYALKKKNCLNSFSSLTNDRLKVICFIISMCFIDDFISAMRKLLITEFFFSAWNIFHFLLLFLNGIYAECLLNVIYFYSLFYFTLKLFHRKDINNSFCMAKMLWHLCSACRRCYNILCYKCWAYGYHNGGAFRKTVLTTAASEGIFHLIKWK